MTFCLWTVSAKQSVAALSTTHCPPRIDADSNKTKLRIITDYNKTKSRAYVLDQMLRLNWHKGSYPTMTGLHLLRHPEQSRHRRQCTLQWSNRADFKEEIHLWPEHIDCVNHWAENGSRNLIEWLKTWNARGNAPHFFSSRGNKTFCICDSCGKAFCGKHDVRVYRLIWVFWKAVQNFLFNGFS